MIEARGLSKRFRDKKRGEIRAVDSVSFTCQPGRIYGLLGANGAGKTTTLRMLATILEPTDGTALVCGHEMVEYFGRLNGLDEPTLKKRVDDIFNRLDMNGFRDRRCDKLSTGMKQKTSIARTLVHDPPVMIFDEPTLGLDVMTARTITAFIRECRDNGKTVIFSTHVMSEVEKLCDTIGIIHDGKLLTEGTLAQLRDKYAEHDLEEIFVKVVGPLHSDSEACTVNFHNIVCVYRKELTEWLRDRRTLISTVLVPLLAFPVLMVGMVSLSSMLFGKAEKEVPK